VRRYSKLVAEKMSILCQNCHSLEGGGSEVYGPSPAGISAVAGTRVRGLDTVEHLRESILDPSAYIVDGFEDTMEKFYSLLLTEDDVNNLIAFMLTE
jgi:cytochrome c2